MHMFIVHSHFQKVTCFYNVRFWNSSILDNRLIVPKHICGPIYEFAHPTLFLWYCLNYLVFPTINSEPNVWIRLDRVFCRFDYRMMGAGHRFVPFWIPGSYRWRSPFWSASTKIIPLGCCTCTGTHTLIPSNRYISHWVVEQISGARITSVVSIGLPEANIWYESKIHPGTFKHRNNWSFRGITGSIDWTTSHRAHIVTNQCDWK